MTLSASAADLSSAVEDDTWVALAQKEPTYPFFAHPAYARAFVGCFGDRAKTFLIRFRAARGRLCAVQPMMISRHLRHLGLVPRYDYLAGDAAFLLDRRRGMIPLRQLSPLLGLEASNLRMASCRGEVDVSDFWQALAPCLQKIPGWDIGVFPIDANEYDAAARAFRKAGCPVFCRSSGRAFLLRERPASIAQIIAAAPKKFRQNVRRAEAEAKASGIRIEMAEGARVRALMPEFAELGLASWKAGNLDVARGRGQAMLVPYRDGQRVFFETLVDNPALSPVMATARGREGLFAACLGFFEAGTLTTMLTLHRPSTGKAGHGRLVLHEILDWAWRHDARRIDFNTTAEWPSIYADHAVPNLHLVVMRPGLRGHALAVLASLKGRAA